MKRYLILLAIAISSCSTHSTAPVTTTTPIDTTNPTPVPGHPFPRIFARLIVTYQNIPSHWVSSASYNYLDSTGVIRTNGTSSSGDHLLSRALNFNFTSASFQWMGDSANIGAVQLALDTVNGLLDYFSIAWGQGLPSDPDFSIFELYLDKMQYKSDSSNGVLVELSGQSLKNSLVEIDSVMEYYNGDNMNRQQGSYSDEATLAVSDSSTLTIHFIP